MADQSWNLIGNFWNGGIEVGLYAWDGNKKKIKFEDYVAEYK